MRVGKRARTFILKKNNSRVKLGNNPTLSLQDARRKAMLLKTDTTVHGPDITLSDARKLFLETHCRNYRPRPLGEAERFLNKFTSLDKKKVAQITKYQVQGTIDDIDAPSEQNHTFKIARTFFRLHPAPVHPAQPPSGPTTTQQRDAAKPGAH